MDSTFDTPLPLIEAIPASASSSESTLVTYEQRLNNNSRWALTEGSLFFQGQGSVQIAMRRIAQRLDELGVPYAIVGGMALFQYGFRRFTEDVDLLVTSDDLKRIHAELDGRGYLPPFTNSRSLRDTELGVKIEFLVTGGYPGDGKPKPVVFPDPAIESVELDGRRYIPLNRLVELKLASGMTNPHRLKDLADVQELTKALQLPIDFADQLDPYVQQKFRDLWAPSDVQE
ncbi:MAG: hypothetical protein JWP89_2964 [Schlesneria sp.]|nr:hypothetical protein [Schlesneria sp.]